MERGVNTTTVFIDYPPGSAYNQITKNLARIMHDSITVVNYPSEGQPFIGFLLDIKQNIIIAVIFTACNLPVVL